ncbi:hypothetical protein DFH08DRAFT_811856 [Mycena albidolilacea]|uniref:Uncharacterized protein n=1 Tax=Mycena albidolilacea TaxID=1033008 RepID=A0AAD6ZV90_9AGAR|nr:hypothetical protein DFH08DRAFT_811856 [Mycena albidolilacea]
MPRIVVRASARRGRHNQRMPGVDISETSRCHAVRVTGTALRTGNISTIGRVDVHPRPCVPSLRIARVHAGGAMWTRPRRRQAEGELRETGQVGAGRAGFCPIEGKEEGKERFGRVVVGCTIGLWVPLRARHRAWAQARPDPASSPMVGSGLGFSPTQARPSPAQAPGFQARPDPNNTSGGGPA